MNSKAKSFHLNNTNFASLLLVVSLSIALLLFLYRVFHFSYVSYRASPDTLLFKLVFEYAMRTIFLMPLPLLLGVFVRKTKVIYLTLVIILPIIFFSWSLGAKYLEWQKFINIYKYPNATNLFYSRIHCSGEFCSGGSKVIIFETKDSMKQVSDYISKHLPVGYAVYKVRQSVRWDEVYTDTISYINNDNDNIIIHESLMDTLDYGQLPKGEAKVRISRED